jgi:hypothetical protein
LVTALKWAGDSLGWIVFLALVLFWAAILGA